MDVRFVEKNSGKNREDRPASVKLAGDKQRSDRETGTTATSCGGIRVLHDKAAALQTFSVVNHTTDQVLQTHRIYHHGHTMFFNGQIAVINLLIKGKTIRKPEHPPPVT